MAGRNALYDLALDGFVGHFACGPMADRASALRWVFTREGHDLTPLFGRDSGRASTAGGIQKPISHLGFSESGLSPLTPVLFPVTHTVLAQMQVACDGSCGMAQIGHENNAGARD